jgi:formylmethanofuran dehydrogenase subunit E
MHNHAGCTYTNLQRTYSVADLAAFHGHLGPYIVLGYRIGRYIRTTFCDDPFRLTARVYCSGTPPESCIVDGVQIGSGCTLGKRNIEIVESDSLTCVFEADGEKITVIPKPFGTPARGEDYAAKIEEIAEAMYSFTDEDLFDIQHV